MLCRDVLSRAAPCLAAAAAVTYPLHAGKRFLFPPRTVGTAQVLYFSFFGRHLVLVVVAPTSLAGSACQEEALAASPPQLLEDSGGDFPKQMEK